MPEDRIARFVDLNACKSIFSEYSTFVLRSATHYRQREDFRADQQEGIVRTCGGGQASTVFFALSCWTRLDGIEPTEQEWNIFPHSVAAIISTPSKVSAFLTATFELGDTGPNRSRRTPFLNLLHRPVAYTDEVGDKVGFDNIIEVCSFTKRLAFAREKEYRFALHFSPYPPIDSYVFCAPPHDYYDTCYINPGACKEDKTALWYAIANAIAGYGHFAREKMSDIIANSDILLP